MCKKKGNTIETSLRWQNERLVVCQMSRNTVHQNIKTHFVRRRFCIKALSMSISLLNDNSWITFVANGMRPGSRTLRCLSNNLKGHAVTTPNAQIFLVLRPALFTLYNRLQASKAKESDVLSLLQRHVALMRHEPGEKVYEERARGQTSCWTKILKSSPAMAEPSDTRCVKKSIQASRHLGVFGRCVIQGERRLLKSDQVCNAIECTSTFMRNHPLPHHTSNCARPQRRRQSRSPSPFAAGHLRDISPAFVQTRTASAKNVNLHSLQMVVDGRCQRGQDQATPYIVWATTQCTGMKNTLAL